MGRLMPLSCLDMDLHPAGGRLDTVTLSSIKIIQRRTKQDLCKLKNKPWFYGALCVGLFLGWAQPQKLFVKCLCQSVISLILFWCSITVTTRYCSWPINSRTHKPHFKQLRDPVTCWLVNFTGARFVASPWFQSFC